MDDTKLCKNCEKTFPARLFQPLRINGGSYLMCPICSLKTVNMMHGLPETTPFRGEAAQVMYLEALVHLRETGQDDEVKQ